MGFFIILYIFFEEIQTKRFTDENIGLKTNDKIWGEISKAWTTPTSTVILVVNSAGRISNPLLSFEGGLGDPCFLISCHAII